MAEGTAYSLHTIWWLGLADITTTKLEKDQKNPWHNNHNQMDIWSERFSYGPWITAVWECHHKTTNSAGFAAGPVCPACKPTPKLNIWTFPFLVVVCAYCIGANSIATNLFMVLIFCRSTFLNIGTTYLVNSLILLIPKYNNIQWSWCCIHISCIYTVPRVVHICLYS